MGKRNRMTPCEQRILRRKTMPFIGPRVVGPSYRWHPRKRVRNRRKTRSMCRQQRRKDMHAKVRAIVGILAFAKLIGRAQNAATHTNRSWSGNARH